MKKIYFRNLILILGFIQVICPLRTYSQISKGGVPISFKEKGSVLNKVPIINMPNFNLALLIKEDSIKNRNFDKSLRFAKAFDVNIDIKSQGLMEAISDSGKIWRLGIKSAGAYSLNLIFKDFELPSAAKIFIYSSDLKNGH